MITPVDIAPGNDRELVIARRIALPAQALYRCWTDPELIPLWFCPQPWKAEVVKMDVRPGGASQMIFRGPDGQEFPNDGVYLEVTPGRRLVFTDAYGEDWQPTEKPMFTGLISFEDLGNRETLYVARARHWTREDAERHAQMGFTEGWGVCAEQMTEVAKGL